MIVWLFIFSFLIQQHLCGLIIHVHRPVRSVCNEPIYSAYWTFFAQIHLTVNLFYAQILQLLAECFFFLYLESVCYRKVFSEFYKVVARIPTSTLFPRRVFTVCTAFSYKSLETQKNVKKNEATTNYFYHFDDYYPPDSQIIWRRAWKGKFLQSRRLICFISFCPDDYVTLNKSVNE